MKLYLSGVNATGKIPESFGHLTSLRRLRIASCNLSGFIPKPLWNLTNIDVLDLAYNHLEGPISDFFRFGKISWLLLRNNNFDGQIEFLSFSRWMQLELLDCSFNFLTGPIPSNEFYSESLFTVSLKQNQLQGPIPKSLLNQQRLQFLVFSRNNLSGQIDSTVCNLTSLQVLNLGSNNLEGTIPLCFGEMSELQALDLSNNSLSGAINTTFSIGNQLASLKSLEVLNLSHNHLVGCIPKGKQFDTFENSSYQGNDGLRGLPLSKDCGGNEGVPQATTPYGLDQEEEERDLSIISWQAVFMGYGCGLVIGLSIIYIMLLTQYPTWFSRMDVELEHKILTRTKKHKKRH
ncbi:hypothetical protein KY290_000285 [Solanum tuberosum]|uniref:Uncharacterized protein n=1 Tax=Solanum tuberosum TaxID=4113 RepID=A0ABQ7WIW7_SOLTU|nr:hypothetical protein KY290_000285 [Solanum tuberosum]